MFDPKECELIIGIIKLLYVKKHQRGWFQNTERQKFFSADQKPILSNPRLGFCGAGMASIERQFQI